MPAATEAAARGRLGPGVREAGRPLRGHRPARVLPRPPRRVPAGARARHAPRGEERLGRAPPRAPPHPARRAHAHGRELRGDRLGRGEEIAHRVVPRARRGHRAPDRRAAPLQAAPRAAPGDRRRRGRTSRDGAIRRAHGPGRPAPRGGPRLRGARGLGRGARGAARLRGHRLRQAGRQGARLRLGPRHRLPLRRDGRSATRTSSRACRNAPTRGFRA